MSRTKRLQRTADLERLYTVIREITLAGQLVPCMSASRDWWTSDDHEEQQAAAYGCMACSALPACAQYRATHKEDAGVWAGQLPPKQMRTRP